MNKGIIIGGVIILGAAASAPYICGSLIESKYDQEITHVQTSLKQMDSKLKLEKISYEKGWFSSTAKTLMTINNREFPIESKITHGPFSYFGLGKIESYMAYSNNSPQQKIVDNLFAGKQPLLITTSLSFSGIDNIDIYSAQIDNKPLPHKVNEPITIINWSGLKGNISVKNNNMLFDIKAPKLSLTNEKISLNMDNFTITGNNGYTADTAKLASINWSGETVLNVDKLVLTTDKANYSSKINLTSTSTDDEANIGGKTVLKLTNIEIPQQLDFALSANNLAEFSLSFNGIPKQPLVDFLVKVDNLQKQGKNLTEDIAKPFAIAFLQATPSISAQILMQDDVGNASVSAEAKLATPDSSANDLMVLSMNVMNRLEITIIPSFSETLLDEVIKQEQFEISKDEFIQDITKNNRFTLNNGEFTGKFEFKKGQFYSNGLPDPELQRTLPYLLPRGLL